MQKPISICVVEDNLEDAQRLLAFLKQYKEDNPSFLFTSEIFNNVGPFVDRYSKRFDIIFMDIDFNHNSEGFAAIEQIRKIDNDVAVIFVTNMAKFAVKGYEVSAFDFIVKPIIYSVFCIKMQRLLAHLETRRSSEVVISAEKRSIKVNTEKLLYVEVARHRIIYHTVDGNISTYDSMKNVEEKINDPLFCKCNNCYLVNLRFVDSLDTDFVYIGKDKLLMSLPRKSQFKKCLTSFLCGGGK
jgi:two-component system, LytTR family, response regulator LytT